MNLMLSEEGKNKGKERVISVVPKHKCEWKANKNVIGTCSK